MVEWYPGRLVSKLLGQAAEERGGRPLGPFGLGPGGECVCPVCGYRKPHEIAKPCFLEVCPKCGSRMTRYTGSPAESGKSLLGFGIIQI
jgi:hypothetical protein